MSGVEVCRTARDTAYQRICLDTLPDMHAARRLYAALGFSPIAPYTFNPIAGAGFLGLELRDPRAIDLLRD